VRVPVDDYCERLGPGLWGEPLNAVSNLAFLLASAVLLWRLVRREERAPFGVWLLPVLLGVVGLCSLAFHTFATEVTGLLDTLSIILFILAAIVLIAGWCFGVPWRWAWVAAPAYLGFALGMNAALAAIGGEKATLGGYLPAFAMLAGLGIALKSRKLLIAGGVFVVSLTLRTLDLPLCDQVPIGTHFLWHCLNAVVLYLVSDYVIERGLSAPVSATHRDRTDLPAQP
jgi:hypothetical protein